MWDWLAKEFLVKGTFGDLAVMIFSSFVLGVLSTVVVYNVLDLKKQLKEKLQGKKKEVKNG